MTRLQKPKTTKFYIGFSLLLIVAGVILVLTADFSQKSNSSNRSGAEIFSEGSTYPWGESGPSYVYRKAGIYEFCKATKCWGFDINKQNPTKNGNAYNMPNRMYSDGEIEYGIDHQDFSLNLKDNLVYVCSDEYCWYVDEGLNNLVETQDFSNTSGQSSEAFLNFQPLNQ